jgi:hypothetical protein
MLKRIEIVLESDWIRKQTERSPGTKKHVWDIDGRTCTRAQKGKL